MLGPALPTSVSVPAEPVRFSNPTSVPLPPAEVVNVPVDRNALTLDRKSVV